MNYSSLGSFLIRTDGSAVILLLVANLVIFLGNIPQGFAAALSIVLWLVALRLRSCTSLAMVACEDKEAIPHKVTRSQYLKTIYRLFGYTPLSLSVQGPSKQLSLQAHHYEHFLLLAATHNQNLLF